MKNLISGSLTKTKLVQITDFGESTMELRGKDLEQKRSELRLENREWKAILVANMFAYVLISWI